jgi:threonine dehydrogenase-like Zn-dependent dehydrogenase
MKALCWHGKSDIRCETVPDPKIEAPRDAIIKVTACAICGSDLHIFNGVIPEMKRGDIIGHETMGEIVEVGSENKKLKVGDRVVVPFTIACGDCFFCRRGFYSGCERSNPDRKTAEKMWGRAAEFCNIQGGETIAVWGCGPVGQFAIKSAFLLGANRVIAVDTVPETT